MHTRRWLIFVLLVPAYTALMVVLTAIVLYVIAGEWGSRGFDSALEDLMDIITDDQWWVYAGTGCAIGVALQAVFLLPLFASTPPRGERGRSLTISLIMGTVVATALVTGLVLGLIDLLSLIDPDRFSLEDKHPALWVFVGLTIPGSWLLWTMCLLVYSRGIWADRVLGRMVGLLLAGTALELLVVLPIDVMVRRRTDCYCAMASFFALCLACGAALWLAGPGIAIALLSKRHRAWRKFHCGRCGYPQGPTPGKVCSECGLTWIDRKPEAK